MSDAMPKLPSVSWITNLKDDDRELLSSYGEFIPAHPETPFIVQGENQENLYLIISGSIEVSRDGQTIATLSEGSALGEVNVFDPGTATATVAATEFSQLWRISREELLHFIHDNPGAGNQLLFGLASTLASRIRGNEGE
jgi:CRP/FNR family transcriptional regulator, cyclic AMP receptor protein